MTTNNKRLPDADNAPETATPTPNKINTLMESATRKTAAFKQERLNLGIEKQAEFNGIEMGVLSDGTPFLTGRGLASLCGVHHSLIQGITADWEDTIPKTRISVIRDILSSRGISFERPYVEIRSKGVAVFAYPDAFCLAVLEYYAFEADSKKSDVATRNFRSLAGHALRELIYRNLGYDPNVNVLGIWRQFHDRVSLVYKAVPAGYFGIFKEIAEMIVTLGQAGVPIDASTVPDISVGKCWSKHWTDSAYDWHYGERRKYEHNYPLYFPQSASNPQEPWCYPEAALGEFRRWFREAYIGQGKYEKYLLGKVDKKDIDAPAAKLAIAAYAPVAEIE